MMGVSGVTKWEFVVVFWQTAVASVYVNLHDGREERILEFVHCCA